VPSVGPEHVLYKQFMSTLREKRTRRKIALMRNAMARKHDEPAL
jgi:hypothetical protein